MVEVPVATPVTTPVELTVALAVTELLQVPPLLASLSVVVPLTHTESAPVIVPASGKGLTVIDLVATAVPQLEVTEYDIIAVPALTPVITPEASTVAIVLSLLLQVPPLMASV
jgi:hypothetical protein